MQLYMQALDGISSTAEAERYLASAKSAVRSPSIDLTHAVEMVCHTASAKVQRFESRKWSKDQPRTTHRLVLWVPYSRPSVLVRGTLLQIVDNSGGFWGTATDTRLFLAVPSRSRVETSTRGIHKQRQGVETSLCTKTLPLSLSRQRLGKVH